MREEKQRENTLRHTGGHAPVIMRVGLLKKEGGAGRWEEGYLSLFPPSALVLGVPKAQENHCPNCGCLTSRESRNNADCQIPRDHGEHLMFVGGRM